MDDQPTTPEPTAEELLRAVDECYSHRDALAAARYEQELVIMAAVQADLSALEEEFAPGFETIDAEIASLTEQLKARGLAEGASIKAEGCRYQVVYRKGSKSVDWDKMDRIVTKLAKIDPALSAQLTACFSYGEPSASVQLRRGAY